MIKKVTTYVVIGSQRLFVTKYSIFGFCFYQRAILQELFERHGVSALSI